MRKIVIGQAGGPTAVINTTLYGLTYGLYRDCALTFIEDGFDGLVRGRFVEGTDEVYSWIEENKNVPGACLGSGRFPMDDRHIKKIVDNLKDIGADALAIIGGNGTMQALRKIENKVKKEGLPLQIIGLPKTVDNDLGVTDHSPGFASAAKYIANATLDMSRDLYSMKNFEQVRILETMGRNTGWLAAASGLYRKHEEDGPHFIAIPEKKLIVTELLETIDNAVEKYGCALVIVSEGVELDLDREANQITRNVVHGRPILGGVSSEIEPLVQNELGLVARSELLGINQRSASMSVSSIDRDEAYRIGTSAAGWIKQGATGVMASIQRKETIDYDVDIKHVSLNEVVDEGERKLPHHFIRDFNAYYEWLAPLVGENTTSYPSPTSRSINHDKK